MFSGVGGFELGIDCAFRYLQSQLHGPENLHDNTDKLVEWKCVGYSEIDKYASAVYEYHWKGHKNYGDATRIIPEELPDFDLLVGGFPCQAFSIAGKRLGFEDTRGTLFFDIARIAKVKKPMFMVLENVKGLGSHDKGKTIEAIVSVLQEIGYYTNYEVYNSKDFGVPQNRERIFFVCKHIRHLESVGRNTKMTSCENTIQEFLFQILLKNLKEVKKLQEHASKDSVVGYLLLNEINRNIQNQDTAGSMPDGIMTDTEESLFPSKAKEVWQSIDISLKQLWDENFQGKKSFTILTSISEITALGTYTYSLMLLCIVCAIVQLRNSSSNLWNEILLSLTVIAEDTKYVRINAKTEKHIVTESGALHISDYLQDPRKYFVVTHLGESGCGKVFPIGEGDAIHNQKQHEGIAGCLFATCYKGVGNDGTTLVRMTDENKDSGIS